MNAWDMYKNRITAHGGSKRNAAFIRESRFIQTRLPDNLSYQTVIVYPREYGFNINSEDAQLHCISQNVAIIDSDNLNEKIICSMPSEDLLLGSLIFWMDNYWLVCERDANTTLYTKGKLLQCNHLLKWITSSDEIIEQWCIVEDGTKYLTGEYEDRNFVVTRGDSRISVQLAKNIHTNVLNRENRFLIDDDDSPHKLAYLLTKPFKKGSTYNGEGTFKFVLQEVTATEYDNHELGIADYYIHFPQNKDMGDDAESDEYEELPSQADDDEGKKVWI